MKTMIHAPTRENAVAVASNDGAGNELARAPWRMKNGNNQVVVLESSVPAAHVDLIDEAGDVLSRIAGTGTRLALVLACDHGEAGRFECATCGFLFCFACRDSIEAVKEAGVWRPEDGSSPLLLDIPTECLPCAKTRS